jgi:Fe2+ or Zn2+ uptake regulation protein
MGIRRSNETSGMVAQCDQCFDIVDFEDGEDFEQAKIAIDADGWKTKRVDGKWQNICPDCQ